MTTASTAPAPSAALAPQGAPAPEAATLSIDSPAPGLETELYSVTHLGYRGRWRLALSDLAQGIRLSPLFRTLGWLDIKIRYRGSVLGPLWLTLSTAIMVATIGVLYAELFHIKLHDFLPFVALSLVLWSFLSMLVTDACVVFTQSESTIRSMRMPFFVFAGQSIYRNILILGHNLIVIVVVFAIFKIWPGLAALAAIPAILIWLIDSFAITILLGAFCARFRDVPPIVASILQIAFYASPIIWKPELLPAAQRAWLSLDPFYSLFEIVRGPLLGTVPPPVVWFGACGFSLALCIVAWLGFVRVRNRIAFWI